MQGDAVRWATDVYRRHKHRSLDGQTPASVFTAIERDALIPLPPRSFDELSTVNALHRLRAIQGILRLRDTYGDPQRRHIRAFGPRVGNDHQTLPATLWRSAKTTMHDSHSIPPDSSPVCTRSVPEFLGGATNRYPGKSLQRPRHRPQDESVTR